MTQAHTPFEIVCFDCDSTLSRIEGIDELAARANVREKIEPLTRAAMDGGIPLNEVYGRRLELVRPGLADIDWLAGLYIEQMVSGAGEAVAALADGGVAVHIISGGLRQSILPLADALGVARKRVHAVDVYFDDAGSYAGFDESSPLTTPSGKASVCGEIGDGTARLAMIGDGLTDVAAREAGAFVVGFGGVERRDAVVDGADVFCEGPSLLAALDALRCDGTEH